MYCNDSSMGFTSEYSRGYIEYSIQSASLTVLTERLNYKLSHYEASSIFHSGPS